MNGHPRDRVVPVLLSLLFHGGLVALLVFGWWQWRSSRSQPPPQPLAIEATVVTAAPPAAAPAVEPAVAAPEPAPSPPQPPAEDTAARDRAAQARAEQAQADKARAEREQAERALAAREQAEREAAARDKAAREAADKEQAARAAADKQRKETQQKQVESELRASLAAEARQTSARLSSAKAAYVAMIREKIQHNWIKPPSAHAGLDCVVNVTQVPGGQVTDVTIGTCNGDEAVKGSIRDAVYRASPLPEPADPAVFDRNLVFNFKPNE